MALHVTVESSTSVSVKEFDGGVKYESSQTNFSEILNERFLAVYQRL